MRVIDSINGGYSACGGRCNSGWYGGVLVLEDKDEAFVDCPTDASFEERASHCREWINATVPPKRRIILVTPCDDGVKQEVIAEAEYVEGPICPREQTETPVLAWIERHDARWHLMLYQDDTLCTVVSSDDVIRRATLIRDGDVLPWTDVGAMTTTLDLVDPSPTPGSHWYVPTVEVETAYEKDHFGICHGSPYFVTGR